MQRQEVNVNRLKKNNGEKNNSGKWAEGGGDLGGNQVPVRAVPQCHLSAFSSVSTPVYMPIMYL